MGVQEADLLSKLQLPPGFRFYPTDEELMVQYLCRKVAGHQFSLPIIGDIDLYKFDPWDLPSKAIFGEKEWYFFSPRDRKYPNGSRPNRVAGSGYWKATGTDKVITTEGRRVGIKKALVFYVGKAPKGVKTNWIMHEYRLCEPPRKNGSTKLDDWVLCRIYKKNSSAQKSLTDRLTKEQSCSHNTSSSSSSQFDDMLESLPQINDRSSALPRMNSLQTLNLQNLNSGGNFNWAGLAGVRFSQELAPAGGNMTNDVYIPSRPTDEEVQSGLRTQQRIESTWFNQQNLDSFSQGLGNSVDQFGVRYPTQTGRFGFQQ